jgi:hypothetical protein
MRFLDGLNASGTFNKTMNSSTISYAEFPSNIGVEPQTASMPAVNGIVYDQEEQ